MSDNEINGYLRYHIIPINDIKDGDLFIHYAQAGCPCYPHKENDNIMTHNAYDCRERFERQDNVKTTQGGWIQIREMVPILN